MKSKYQYKLCVLLILSILGIVLVSSINHLSGQISSQYIVYTEIPSQDLTISADDNSDLLESIFDSKILDYNNKGFFPKIYDPSLQATYYALYTLNSVGKLHEINQSEVTEYIMDLYEESNTRFMDTLAYRYLDTDFAKVYFPLNTILETTCYSILSLNLLDSLHLINTQDMIDFIWGCYNPVSGGFIGQPYNIGLEDGFKIATADNTYFAVITLDLLMDDWLGYSTQRDAIISFINGLQVSSGNGWASGGFNNDENEDFRSLLHHFEPNLLSSYYCIKALDKFEMVSSIDDTGFHQFLTYLYDSNYNYFRISDIDYGANYTNIIATSIGLELSNITNFTGINRAETLNFILDNRNALGNWDQASTVPLHELIDTYQILRSLDNTGDISLLAYEDRNQIGNATLYYKSHEAFSNLSEDYTPMNLIHTIVNAFDYYDRISELNIQQIYQAIKNSYVPFPHVQTTSRFFYGFLKEDTIIEWFRSYPIEFHTSGHKNYIHLVSQQNSHQSTYYALESLQKMFKLDDFAGYFNMMDLANDIVNTQFLNDSYYDTFGAFSSILKYSKKMSDIIENRIYSDYSYYAIRSLEILGTYLGLDLAQLGVDTTALYTYIDRNIVETPTTWYFNPYYANDVETILKTTYYMTYVLNSLDLYNRNNQKIKTYIESNLNYSNIKNIYYSYKLSELLDLNVIFDFHQIHSLVQDIYSEQLNEFYLTINKEALDQEIFLWICDMARKSQIGIEAYYSDACQLGSVNYMEVSLYNLVLKDFGTYITFKFESDQIGTFVFSKLANNSYIYEVPIPLTSDSYPVIEGYLRAYEGLEIKAEQYISFSTHYSLQHDVSSHTDITGLLFEINASILANNEQYPIISGNAFVRIYRNDAFLREIQAEHQIFPDYSLFSIGYNPIGTGQFYFEFYLNDGVSSSSINIRNILLDINEISERNKENIMAAIPLTIVFIAVPGTVVVVSSKKLNKSKKESEYN
jgi:prenyltransferase beta subunit